MEVILDRLVEELNVLADLDYDEGGFADEVKLAENVWFGDPRVVADHQYPLLYVQPVNSTPAQGTTGFVHRDHNIEIGLLADPRTLYDTSEVVEATASREMIRAASAIERWLEKKSLAMPNGLGENSRSLTVGETSYPSQARGTLLVASVVINITVGKRYARAS